MNSCSEWWRGGHRLWMSLIISADSRGSTAHYPSSGKKMSTEARGDGKGPVARKLASPLTEVPFQATLHWLLANILPVQKNAGIEGHKNLHYWELLQSIDYGSKPSIHRHAETSTDGHNAYSSHFWLKSPHGLSLFLSKMPLSSLSSVSIPSTFSEQMLIYIHSE